MKNPLIFLFIILYSSIFQLYGQNNIKILTHKDTLFLSFNSKGEKIVTHLVKKGQTFYSISEYYKMTSAELKSLNPNIKSEVKEGDKISIKIPNASITRFQTKNFVRWKFAPICYTVKKGDNLFNIAKTHFKMPIDSLKKKNNIKSTIKEGMILNVGWFNLEGVPEKKTSTTPVQKDSIAKPKLILDEVQENYAQLFQNQGGSSKTVKGKAFWQKNSYKSKDYLCMHRTAKINSYVRLTNPMNNKVAYARVASKMNDKAYDSQTLIVLSPNLAKYMGAVDQNFFVKIEYR